MWSLKADALLWLDNIGKFLISDEAQHYQQSLIELKKASPAIRDKSVLCRDFC